MKLVIRRRQSSFKLKQGSSIILTGQNKRVDIRISIAFRWKGGGKGTISIEISIGRYCSIRKARGTTERRFVLVSSVLFFPASSINFYINSEHDYPHPVIRLYPAIHVSFEMPVNAFVCGGGGRKGEREEEGRRKGILFRL